MYPYNHAAPPKPSNRSQTESPIIDTASPRTEPASEGQVAADLQSRVQPVEDGAAYLPDLHVSQDRLDGTADEPFTGLPEDTSHSATAAYSLMNNAKVASDSSVRPVERIPPGSPAEFNQRLLLSLGCGLEEDGTLR